MDIKHYFLKMTLEQLPPFLSAHPLTCTQDYALPFIDCFKKYFCVSKDLMPARIFNNFINLLIVPPNIVEVRDISNKVPKSLHFLT